MKKSYQNSLHSGTEGSIYLFIVISNDARLDTIMVMKRKWENKSHLGKLASSSPFGLTELPSSGPK